MATTHGPNPLLSRRRFVAPLAASPLAWMLGGCASPPPPNRAAGPAPNPPARAPAPAADPYPWLNRLSWGASPSSAAQAARLGFNSYLAQQLHPGAARLPAEAESAIAAMTISQRPMVELARAMAERRREAESL
ncbi:MAG: hypothetical protein KGM91_11395, partial [Burkholderiales bacterium]|nr:hypothetical protein [Burkholderiales bacterium]